MSFPANTILGMTPCDGPGPCARGVRAVSGTLSDTGFTIAGTTNMKNWITNFDLTQVPWGYTAASFWSEYTDTEPYAIRQEGGATAYSETDLYSEPGNLTLSGGCSMTRCQVWLGTEVTYMCMAVGWLTGPMYYAASTPVAGCVFNPQTSATCNNLIVDIPVPNPAVGDYCYKYIFMIQGPNPTGGNTGQYPSLAAAAQALYPNAPFGPNWNPAAVCSPANGDPFAFAL